MIVAEDKMLADPNTITENWKGSSSVFAYRLTINGTDFLRKGAKVAKTQRSQFKFKLYHFLLCLFATFAFLREHLSSDCLSAGFIDRLSRPTS